MEMSNSNKDNLEDAAESASKLNEDPKGKSIFHAPDEATGLPVTDIVRKI